MNRESELPTIECLSEKHLRDLLSDRDLALNGLQEQHLAECVVCRERMERLAGSAIEWKTMEENLIAVKNEFEATESNLKNQFESTFFCRVELMDDNSKQSSEEDRKFADVSEGRFNEEDDELRVENKGSVGVESTVGDSEIGFVKEVLDPPSHPENLGRVDRYEIEYVVGRGGMGVVFKGFDAELNRPVAVKILSPHFSGHGTARQRFTREAKAAAAVVHDNVVPIYDIQADNHRPFIVMPYVNGVSLQGHVENDGQIETKSLLRVALQIASGLSAAHAQGLVHRDIKPANILLENGLNRVQITDFGLARAADDAAMTHSGLIAGTPHYMSPEQTRGNNLDHRSDLFSLGCVMYFMATGRTLYRGDGPYSLIAQIGKGDYKPVREVNSDVPAFVADIIDRLLELEPADRFQNATQLISQLERSLVHLQQPMVVKAPRRLWSSRRKRWWKKVSVVGVSVLASLGVIWFGLFLMFSENGLGARSGVSTGKRSDPANNDGVARKQNGVGNRLSHQPSVRSLKSFEEIERDISGVANQLGELELMFQGPQMGVQQSIGFDPLGELEAISSEIEGSPLFSEINDR